MGIEVTIVLPSYNRYPYNLLALHSLQSQSFDPSKTEVVLIDDASTDETPTLRDYRAPFAFRYIRNKRNRGCSKTRNIGIRRARGRILIFLDAEVIVGPDFVAHHVRRHRDGEPLVVIGKHIYNVYSHLFPELTEHQISGLLAVSRRSPAARERVERHLSAGAFNEERLRAGLQQLARPVPLLFKSDFESFDRIEELSVPRKYENKILPYFGDDFRLPWVACTTLNHSISRKLAAEIGGFDENLVHTGFEDYEYGFRLHRRGARFEYAPDIRVYHQEHPISGSRSMGGTRNLILFQRKHPCLDVCLLSLTRINRTDFRLMNDVLREDEAIRRLFPGRFDGLTDAVRDMLMQIPVLKAAGRKATRLLHASGREAGFRDRLSSGRNELERLGFSRIVELFDLLVNL